MSQARASIAGERASEKEKERVQERGRVGRARERKSERDRQKGGWEIHVRRGGLRSPSSYSGTVALTTRIHACAHATPAVTAASQQSKVCARARAPPVASVTLAFGIAAAIVSTTTTTTIATAIGRLPPPGCRIPPPSPRRSRRVSRSALFLSVPLPPFLSPPSSSWCPGEHARARARTRQRVNGSVGCHRRETSFRADPVTTDRRSLARSRYTFHHLPSPHPRRWFSFVVARVVAFLFASDVTVSCLVSRAAPPGSYGTRLRAVASVIGRRGMRSRRVNIPRERKIGE